MPALVPFLFPLHPLNRALRQALKRTLQKSQKSETRLGFAGKPLGGIAGPCASPAPGRRPRAGRASPSCTKKPPGQRLIAQFTPSPLPLDAPRAGRGKPLSAPTRAARPASGRIHAAAVSPHVFAAAPDHPLYGLRGKPRDGPRFAHRLAPGHSVLAMLRLALHGPPPKRVVRRRWPRRLTAATGPGPSALGRPRSLPSAWARSGPVWLAPTDAGAPGRRKCLARPCTGRPGTGPPPAALWGEHRGLATAGAVTSGPARPGGAPRSSGLAGRSAAAWPTPGRQEQSAGAHHRKTRRWLRSTSTMA